MKVQIERVLAVATTSAGHSMPAASGPGEEEALSVGLMLGTGQVAWGDCVGGGPAFRRDQALDTIQRIVAPALEGRELAGFREMAAEVDALTETAMVARPHGRAPTDTDDAGEPEGQEGISRRALLTVPARLFQTPTTEAPLDQPAGHVEEKPPAEQVVVERRLQAAIRYGVSQALLEAVALARGSTMAQVVADEWGLAPPEVLVPICARCAYKHRREAERMILHRIASLPHASIDDVAQQVGADGGHLTRYLRWLTERIAALGGEQYRPAIHLDLAGALGQITEHHPGHMLGHLHAWWLAAQPYRLRVEDPVLLEDGQAQMEALGTLHDYLRLRKIDVELVAGRATGTHDEVAAFLAAQEAGGRLATDMIHVRMPELGSLHNTVDAVLACQEAGVGVLLGGSTAETEIAARAAAHVALAARPDLILSRPGPDVGAAASLMRNEMARTLTYIVAEHRTTRTGHDRLKT